MELIDRTALKKEWHEAYEGEKCKPDSVMKGCTHISCDAYIACQVIENQPTIEAVPVVRGKWEDPQPIGVMMWDKHAYAQCSVCGQKAYLGWHDNYCRFCGAKMGG